MESHSTNCKICDKTPPYFPEEQKDLEDVMHEEQLFAMAKGMFMIRDPKSEPYQHTNTNFTLFPVKLPLSLFKRMEWFNAKLSQLLMNVLVKAPDWIIQISQEIAKEDPFIQRMVTIAQNYLKNPKQSFTCTILRNDFMIDNTDSPSIELIEFNTISCGLSILGRKVCALHQHAFNCFPSLFPNDHPGHISSEGEIAPGDALYFAFSEYGNAEACVLFIGQENEKNEGDRYGVRLDLFERHHIFAQVASLAQVSEHGKLNEDSGVLYYKGKEVGLVYYRAGYTFQEYGEKEWKAREMIEYSKAVKCPNILLHLLTLKRFQTEFGSKEVLSRFYDSQDPQFQPFLSMFSNFVQLHDLQPRTEELIKEAQKCPEHFVLKTSKEAGEGNIFDTNEISKILSAYPDHPQQFQSQLLMRRLALPSRLTPLSVQGQLLNELTNDEFSLFMYVGADLKTQQIKPQKSITKLVRTKKSTEEQGSFFRGSCLSSIWCYEDKDPKQLDDQFYTGLWEDVKS